MLTWNERRVVPETDFRTSSLAQHDSLPNSMPTWKRSENDGLDCTSTTREAEAYPDIAAWTSGMPIIKDGKRRNFVSLHLPDYPPIIDSSKY